MEISPSRLKGNRVWIPGSPAAVSSKPTSGSFIVTVISLRRIMGRRIRRGTSQNTCRTVLSVRRLARTSRNEIMASWRTRNNDIDVRWRRRECDKTAERLSKCYLPVMLAWLSSKPLFFVISLFVNIPHECCLSLIMCDLWSDVWINCV